jgi:hypothetical protein
MSIDTSVEEADIELCASGFDNLVLDGDLDELENHAKNLKLIGANKCHEVISTLLSWFQSNAGVEPIDLLESNDEKTNDFWENYNTASCAEDPRSLAKLHEKN